MSREVSLELIDRPPENFTCGVESIDAEIEESYLATLCKQAYCYQLICEGELVGYCLINFENIYPSHVSIEEIDNTSNLEMFFTAFHIEYLAIAQDKQRKRYGTKALREIINTAINLSKKYPIRFITIDAVNHLVDWYLKIGFELLADRQNGFTKKMIMDCMSLEEATKWVNYQEECLSNFG